MSFTAPERETVIICNDADELAPFTAPSALSSPV
jgi:hypothetical protein